MRRIYVAGMAMAVSLGTLTACTPDQLDRLLAAIRPAQVVAKGNVYGRVLDQTTQQPVADAKLQIGTAKTTSAADGSYTATGLAAGTLFVRVEQARYQLYFGEVQVTGNGTTRFDIMLKPLPVPVASGSASPAPGSDGRPSPSPVPTATPTPSPSASVSLSPIPTPSPVSASDVVAGSDLLASPTPRPSVTPSV